MRRLRRERAYASASASSSSTMPTYHQSTIPMLLHQAATMRDRPARVVMAYTECAGCLCTLMYPRGAASVRCAACGTVSSVAPASGDGGSTNGALTGASPGSKPRRAVTSENLVVIENPPTLDARGNVVSYIAVGVLCDSDEEE